MLRGAAEVGAAGSQYVYLGSAELLPGDTLSLVLLSILAISRTLRTSFSLLSCTWDNLVQVITPR